MGSKMKTMSQEYQRLGKRPERAHAVVIGEVEQNVAESGEAGVEEEQSPARWEVRIFHLASAQTPDQIDEADYYGGVEWKSEEGVGEAAMVGEGEGRATEAAEDVQVRSLGGERERERGQRRLAVESGAAQACASRENG